MNKVKRYSSFIKSIVIGPGPNRCRLLKTSNLKIVKPIAKIVYNIINKNIKVPATTLNKLRKFKVFHKLAAAKSTAKSKQILLRNPNRLLRLSALFN